MEFEWNVDGVTEEKAGRGNAGTATSAQLQKQPARLQWANSKQQSTNSRITTVRDAEKRTI